MTLDRATDNPMLAQFSEMARVLLSARKAEDAVFQLIKFVDSYFCVESWSILVHHRKRRVLKFVHASGPGAADLLQKEISSSQGVAGWVTQHKKSALVRDVYQDHRFESCFDQASGFTTQSIIATPLLVEGRVLGVLELINNLHDDKPFTENDLFLLETLATFAASALDRISYVRTLKRYAFKDVLTGVNNRRGFNIQLRREIEMTKKFRTQFTLLLIDIDSFKGINDSFGHPSGDRVLIRVGQVLTECARGIDLVARLGGDEFAVLLPKTGRGEAEALALNIRKVSAANYAAGIPFTLSIGIHVVDPARPWEVFELADKALYKAKASRQRRKAGEAIEEDLGKFHGI